MSDPLRTEAPRAADALSGRERDARVEQLLLQGLDHYFAGQYDQAVHVWTRVLFLDRGHARARAYIERARSALAERQRRSDELLHRGVAAFNSGQTDDARELLTEAVSQGAAPDVALSYLGRIDRLDPSPPPDVVPSGSSGAATLAGPAAVPAEPRARPGTRTAALLAGAFTLVAAGAVALVVVLDLPTWPPFEPATQGASAAPPDEPLPVPRAAEFALARARALFAAGRADEALRALDPIGPADPLQPEADRLRADIQRALLGAVVEPADAAPAEPLR